MSRRQPLSWKGSFSVRAKTVGPDGQVLLRDDVIPLRQRDETVFELGEVEIYYKRRTGLEGKVPEAVIEEARHLDNTKLATTDLASVPALLRWFTNTYGVYTPAALIHDRLIPSHEGSAITDELADRYFRFMLGAVGVPRFKRYIMWTAVAMRTRWFSKQRYKRVLLIIWGATSLLGITSLVASLSAILFDTGLPVGSPREVLGVSLVAPVILSALWWRQCAAGVVAAMTAPWVLPAAIIAGLASGVYRLLELVNAKLLSRVWPEPDNAGRQIGRRRS